jgi:hypothetical protein
VLAQAVGTETNLSWHPRSLLGIKQIVKKLPNPVQAMDFFIR